MKKVIASEKRDDASEILRAQNAALRAALTDLLADYEDAMAEWGTGTAVWERGGELVNAAHRALAMTDSAAPDGGQK